MGLTETGYRRRTYEEILNAKIEKAKELFGEDINTEGNTPLGKYIRINAYDQLNVEELAEKIYYSINPQTAIGQSLDRLGWLAGVSRNPAIPSRYEVLVTGTIGTVVEYGFLVGTESGINFYNTTEETIGIDGTCLIVVECTEAGSIGNVPAADINSIVNPAASIDEVAGQKATQDGEDEESDYDFIKRFEIASEGRGSCNETSIKSALVNIPTVRDAYLIVNESATDSLDGIPPKTIACFVDGGNEQHQAIAEAIFDKKPVGIGTYGDQSATVSYGALENYTVNFSHSKKVDVYIRLTIETSAEFENDGKSQIKQNIVEFIDSLGIGKTLVTTALYSKVYSVAGVDVAYIQVSTNGQTYNTDNITVAPFERCSLAQITMNNEVI